MSILLGFLVPLAILGGLVVAVISGLRSMSGDQSDPIDSTEASKSFALHLGLFIALIAGAVGAIDALQSFVAEPDRLAGSNSDLARGLSLMLVAGPAYGLLLRAISRRTLERLGRVGRSTRGWSVYLFAALGVTMIATLTSIAQIAGDLTGESGAADPPEVMQFFVWSGLWLAHWFLLRPWLRTRTDAHLAVGTIAGLSWLLSGVGAVVFRLLAGGYDAAFGDTLDVDYGISFWLVIGAVGAAVWVFHWLRTFNTAHPSRTVEGDRRGSPIWYFTTVVAGVLPGLVVMLVTVTATISGLLIWFFGTTTAEAADYFEPAPALAAATFVALVTWAYHRWELERLAAQEPDGCTRNEALRFHDYVVVSAGLLAVVGASAALVALLIDTVIAPTSFAESTRSGNDLIIILTVLAAGTAVWWRYWESIERERILAPMDEGDSFWRKLYLITSFGIGGLVFAVSLTWVLFALLRDVFDGVFGRSTVEDLADPIGWALAVVGGVWFHFGVWREDRAVLATRPAPVEPMPPPPAPVRAPVGSTVPPPPAPVQRASVLTTRPATRDDAGELFTLQQADRGDRLATAASVVEPVETFDQMQSRLAGSHTTVVVDRGRIVGFLSRPVSGDTSSVQAVVAPDQPSAEILALLRSTRSGEPAAQN